MKIICIGRNYADHAKELKNEVPTEPVFFMKPDSALLPLNHPFYIPEFTQDLHHEIEVVIRINRLGKHIDRKFAHRYYNEIGLGVDFTARDVQAECKKKGLPWEKAKAFDHSAPVSPTFIPVAQFKDLNNINFSLENNGKTVQEGNTKDLLFSFDVLIEYISKFVTLKIGDLIFTGTPAGVAKVNPGDKLVGKLEGQELLIIDVR